MPFMLSFMEMRQLVSLILMSVFETVWIDMQQSSKEVTVQISLNSDWCTLDNAQHIYTCMQSSQFVGCLHSNLSQ